MYVQYVIIFVLENLLISYRFCFCKTPSILAINHEWTLPEKLISLQKMFNLNRIALVKVVVSQPYLLTSSIERNLVATNGMYIRSSILMLLYNFRQYPIF